MKLIVIAPTTPPKNPLTNDTEFSEIKKIIKVVFDETIKYENAISKITGFFLKNV